jgi:heat shock protein HslJ
MPYKNFGSILIVFSLAFLSSCAGLEVNRADGLIGTWRVEMIESRPVIDISPAELIFLHEGRFAGNASCNRFTGSYQINGSRITVGETGMTRMTCPPALMNQERRFVKTMPMMAVVSFENGILYIRADDNSLVFRASRVCDKAIDECFD